MLFINLKKKPNFIRPELLLHPPIPVPLWGVNPRTIVGQTRWNEMRREVFEKNNDCCWACGVHQEKAKPTPWLEAHELYDINYKKGEMKRKEIVGLCGYCHSFIHKRRLATIVDQGSGKPEHLEAVLMHGTKITTKHKPKAWWNVNKQTKQMVQSRVKWREWYLLYDGNKHYSRFKNKTDHRRYYEVLAQ